MVRCKNCGLVFSHDVLPDDILSNLYSESHVTFNKYLTSLRLDYWRPLAKHVHLIEKNSALDIGCSNGFYLEELLARGFKKLTGFEPSREAKAQAHPSIREGIITEFFNGPSSLIPEPFDLVTSFHTLDHVSNPLSFVKNCREVLKPGGLIYLVTHDVDALQAKILKDKSPIIDIEHIYLFNQKTLPRVVTENGFQLIDSGPLTNSYPLDYYAHMLPMPSSIRSATEKILRSTGLSQLAPRVPMGNIFVIGQLL